MNKAITDGLVLMPPAFENGLDVWSSEDGIPGSNTYDGAANASLVPADQDFGACLELQKTVATQKLRYMGDTTILPGCYLRITARVKAISGNLPSIRVAAWAGGAGGVNVAGLVEVGSSTTLTGYGEVVEVSAIVGTGTRTGVDMAWGTAAIYGHFGLDLTGATGGIVRIDDIVIEDLTAAFHRTMMDWVDVKDFGAIGDGLTDDMAAFEAADAAALGREVLVSEGTFYLGDHVTFESPVRFEGTVTMPDDKRLTLTKNYNFATYADAFAGDEKLALKKALAVLFNYSDHVELDLSGRRIQIDGPIDVQAAIANLDTYAIRRVLRNGQIEASASTNWDTDTYTSLATYAVADPKTLTAVADVANIPVGALVEGTGVGREVYVRSKDVGAGTITLSQELYGAVGTQTFTFKRFKYLLDFSGFASLSRFVIDDVDLQCAGRSSGVMLPREGLNFQIRDCYFTKPKDRGVTSSGRSCQGLMIDRCQFLSNESALKAQDRTTICFNSNANDTKIRGNRVVHFAAFAIVAGTGHLYVGNHWFHGDGETNGIRQAGLIFTTPNSMSAVTGNYIDNTFIELTNEYDATPDFNSQFSFGGLSIAGNIFTATNVAPWFRCIVIKPYGSGHYIHGLNVSGNVFRTIGGNIDRVDQVDTTFATLDMTRARNVIFEGNTFNAVDQFVSNPVTVEFAEASEATTWVCDFDGYLPFNGFTRSAEAFVKDGKIEDAGNAVNHSMPYFDLQQGPNSDQINVVWDQAVRGKIHLTARMDKAT